MNGAAAAAEKKIITKEPEVNKQLTESAETKVNGDVNGHHAETNGEAHSE